LFSGVYLKKSDYLKRKKIRDRLEPILNSKNITLLDPSEVDSTRSRVNIRCSCGFTWESLVSNLLAKKGCPECSKWARGKNKRSTYKKINEIIIAKKGKLLSTFESISGVDKIKIECEKGHQWSPVVSSIVHSDHWCPKCSYERNGLESRTPLSVYIEIAEANGGKCISTATIPEGEKVEFECSKGHRFKAWPANIKKKWTCGVCNPNKFSIDIVNNLVHEQFGGKCLSTKYKESSQSLEWKCSEGHIFKKSWDEVKQGNWCVTCRNNSLTLLDYHAVARRNDGEFLGDEVKSIKTRLPWKCSEGHEFKATFLKAQELWCKKCSSTQTSNLRDEIKVAS
jgi:hypothetical protein